MNPELAALLSQGQTAPPSVAGSPVVSAIQKMMGAGGSAPPMPQQMAAADSPAMLSRNGPAGGPTPTGPSRAATPAETAYRDANPTDTVVENYGRRFGQGQGRYNDHPGADVYDRAHNASVDSRQPQSTEEELEMARKGMGQKEPNENIADRTRGRSGR